MKTILRLLNSRLVNLVFPLADFLYIYQLEEYNIHFFLKWAMPRIYKRNFQKIGNLAWTEKVQALYALVLVFIIFFNLIVSLFLPLLGSWLYSFVLLLILSVLLVPFWITASSILLLPLEHYFKQKQVKNAKRKLMQIKGLRVIAIAGSVGKTSTRHFLNEFLRDKYKVFTPTKNYNTLLGIAEQINSQMESDTQIFIVEMGEYLPGDLMTIAQLVNPEILILTKITNQHLERFKTQDAINAEFISLSSFPTIKNIFITKDNSITKKLIGKSKVNLIDIKKWKIYFDNIKDLKLPRALSVYENLAMAITVSKFMQIKREAVKNVLRDLLPVDRRLVVTTQNGITIVDDSYNISMDSAKNAFDFLKSFKGRKVLVTGGIVEQGKNSKEINEEFGEIAGRLFDVIIIAENNFHRFIVGGIRRSKSKARVIYSKSPDMTPILLSEILNKDDTILIQNELPEVYWH